jgi:hypothetical protein
VKTIDYKAGLELVWKMYRGLLWRAQSTDETFVALKDGRP